MLDLNRANLNPTSDLKLRNSSQILIHFCLIRIRYIFWSNEEPDVQLASQNMNENKLSTTDLSTGAAAHHCKLLLCGVPEVVELLRHGAICSHQKGSRFL